MKYNDAITLMKCSSEDLDLAIEQVSNKLALPPILLGITGTNVTMHGLTNTPIMLYGTLHYIKEVADVFAEELVEDPTDIETDREENQQVYIVDTPLTLSGKVYYANTYFSCSDATFNIIAYVKPRDYIDKGERTIPAFMVMPVLAQVRANMKFNSMDLVGHSNYQDIAYKFINQMNVSFSKVMPKGFDCIAETKPYGV